MKKHYKKQWVVPSDTNPDKGYKVSLTMEDQYQCSCPRWIFKREECKHIQGVKDGIYDQHTVIEYHLVLAMVKEVTMLDDRVTIHVPLRPVEDIDFLATIVYDLMHLGVPWQVIAELEHTPKQWKPAQVNSHILDHGRKVYDNWVKGHGFMGFKYVPLF
jgi:hypothetical protein